MRRRRRWEETSGQQGGQQKEGDWSCSRWSQGRGAQGLEEVLRLLSSPRTPLCEGLSEEAKLECNCN